ncbi:MAG: hypothetical protein IJ897_07355 [Prevotella sp.]|nr:hypothetical protein [Prevotella sp.]MBR4650672.1 hypothetical protein [Prevotella sp.]
MKSLQEIVKELQERLPSTYTVKVDSDDKTMINVYKKAQYPWLQVDFDAMNDVIKNNGLLMWMRVELIILNPKGESIFVPVFHIHRRNEI